VVAKGCQELVDLANVDCTLPETQRRRIYKSKYMVENHVKIFVPNCSS
jgi:hypothetical protein